MVLDKRLSYKIIAIAATTSFATFEFSPAGVPIATAPAINDRGTAAFIAVDSTGEAKVLTGKSDRLTSIADSRGAFSAFRGVDISNEGTVAYLADFDAIGSGIFVGRQAVISTGNQLLDSTVTDLNFLNKGLNIDDSVALWARLANSHSGVFRADVADPSELPFTPQPLYSDIEHYTTTIAADGDSADIYFPSVPNSNVNLTEFPIALMLQGALVDKADYSNFASQVASYGFVVVVPNNERTLSAPNGQSVTGLFADQEQVNDVLAEMKAEDVDASSPIFRIVDTSKMGLLGHSFGGAAGIGATQEEISVPGIGSLDYTPPSELKAGIFYGANFRNQQTGELLPINNQGIAIGLIQGSLDGVASPANAQGTYDQILNPPKALITLQGANHYGITNEDNLQREPNRSTLDQATSIDTISRWSGLFLRATMLGDRNAFDYVFNSGDAIDPNVSVISQPSRRRLHESSFSYQNHLVSVDCP